MTRRRRDLEHSATLAGHPAGAAPVNQPTRPRLLVLASTVPAVAGDATPGFVEDLARALADRYDVTVLAPRVPTSPSRRDFPGGRVLRFAYLPRRWERVADGAILENLRSSPSLWLQVPALVAAEAVMTWRAVHRCRPAVVHAHWLVPQGVVAAVVAPTTPLVVTAHGADVYGLPGAVGARSASLRGASAARAG